jgi:hypothetical protein
MFEKTFILNFNKSASIYKEEEKLEAAQLAVEMRMMNAMRWQTVLIIRM